MFCKEKETPGRLVCFSEAFCSWLHKGDVLSVGGARDRDSKIFGGAAAADAKSEELAAG
jgi:hypothetical protein